MAESKRSAFSATCNRLSQFLREKRSFADIGALDIGSWPHEPTHGSYRPPVTLNLLPKLDVSAENETDTSDNVSVSDRNVTKEREPNTAPLTIFYGGKVMVFDNFSAEKAADLMNLVTREGGMVSSVNTSADVTILPMARRASLHRFLEKRKDRINSRAPYQVNGSFEVGPTSKAHEAKPWLGLGQEASNLC